MQVHGLNDSFNYALQGLIHTLKTQRNMKIHFLIAFIVLFLSLFIDLTKNELLLLFFVISFVIAMELINTAIEVVINMMCKEYSFQAKVAKNIAAAAVLMAAINAMVIGYFIFLDEINHLTLNLIIKIKQESYYFSFIILCLLFILIIVLKALSDSGTPLKGGMPSGHSAISFSIATIVSLLTINTVVTILVYFMAILVAHSRLQTKTHNLLEVFMGALIGIFFTLFVFHFI